MKVYLTIAFIITCNLCFSQQITQPPILKFKSTIWRIIIKDKEGMFESATDWQVNNVMFSLDVNKNKLVVYSEKEQVFDFMTEVELYKDDFGSWFKWKSVLDNDGKKSTIRLLNYGVIQKGGHTHSLYIDYSDKTIQMNVYLNKE